MGARTAVEVPAGVVTVLLADVEGSVRQWEADADTMVRAMAALDAVVDKAVAAHHGVRPVEQGEGDSFVAAFAQPVDAVACALTIQSGLANESLRVRMAVHTDEAQLRGTSNYSGALVNRAARLRALAHGGQIVVSGATHELVAGQLPEGASVVDLGLHRLRDLPAPVRVWQLRHPSLATDFPPLRSPDALATNLPVQLTAFVGRTDELLAARKLLYENRLVTLTGPGGTGKTRLAIELAADVFDAYPAGAWFVDLSPVLDPSDVASTIAATLHLRDEGQRTPLDAVASHFADDKALLLFDNCEHVVGAVATFVDGLLRASPKLDVIVTSREPLSVGGEATYGVPPMALPDPEADAAALTDYDSVELFVDRAHRADPSFSLDDASVRMIATICRQVDALPLAIELAAARARVMSLDAIADTLTRRFDLLTGGPRTGPQRQRSVAECVAWSHDLLDESERILLRRLSVFEGSFAVDAAEAVCQDDVLPGALVLPTLLALVEKSLVAAVGDRYALLATVREFARDRLTGSGDDEHDLRRGHLEFLADLAARSEEGLSGGDAGRWLQRLRAEVPSIEAALDWALVHDRDKGLRLAAGLVHFALSGGNLLRGWRWVEPFVDQADTADPKVGADACFGAGLLVLFCGDMALAMRAPAFLATARSLYEQASDHAGVARTRGMVALMAAVVGGADEVRSEWDASLAELKGAGDDWWVAMLTAIWGAHAVQIGRARAGMPHLEAARTHAEPVGNAFLITYIEGWLAAGYGMLGDHDRALALGERSLAAQREAHDPDAGSFMNFIIGDAHYHRGDLDAAERHARESAVMGERHNIAPHAALGYSLLGRVDLDRRDPERARQHYRRALELSAGDGLVNHFVARHSAGLIAALIQLGELDEARAALERGLAAARAGAASSDHARLLVLAAEMEEAVGNDDAAEDRLHEALSMIVETGARTLAITALERLAAIAARLESDVEAVRVFAAAATIRQELGRRPGDEGALATARARLGPDAFAAAWSDGAAMVLDHVVAYASRGRGSRKRPSTGWASLTPTEREVVRLVAEGLTNPQIGERLFISRGTVRTHLSHVFIKLGVTSRSQLASEATRRGLE